MLHFWQLFLSASLASVAPFVVPFASVSFFSRVLPSTCSERTAESYASVDSLPGDIWALIMTHTDGLSLWNLGVTCMFFMWMVRTEKYGLYTKFLNREAQKAIVMNSNLTLRPWMLEYFKAATAGWALNSHRGSETDLNNGIDLLVDFLTRTDDVRIIQEFFLDRNAPFPEILLPEPMASSLWTGPTVLTSLPGYPLNQPFVFWLPEEGDKFFDTFSLAHIGAITAQDVFSRLFEPALLAQYIIPAWRGLVRLEPRDYASIRALAPLIQQQISDHFFMLRIAIYFATGAHLPGSSQKMRRLYDFFSQLGFDPHVLSRRLPDELKGFNHMAYRYYQPETLLSVARLWELDLHRIALNYDNGASIKNDLLSSRAADVWDFETIESQLTPRIVLESLLLPFATPIKCYVRGGSISRKRPTNDLEAIEPKPRRLERYRITI